MPSYMGSNEIDSSLNVAEVCLQISEVKQVCLSNGQLITDTPAELFERFSSIAVSLPDKASSWSIQLYSSFLAALTADLSEHNTLEKAFIMPDSTTLITKALQLHALRTVRTQACKSLRELGKEKETMTNMLRALNTTQNRGLALNTDGFHNFNTSDNNQSQDHGKNNLQQGPSSAKRAMDRYSGDGEGAPYTNSNPRNFPDLLT